MCATCARLPPRAWQCLPFAPPSCAHPQAEIQRASVPMRVAWQAVGDSTCTCVPALHAFVAQAWLALQALQMRLIQLQHSPISSVMRHTINTPFPLHCTPSAPCTPNTPTALHPHHNNQPADALQTWRVSKDLSLRPSLARGPALDATRGRGAFACQPTSTH